MMADECEANNSNGFGEVRCDYAEANRWGRRAAKLGCDVHAFDNNGYDDNYHSYEC